MFFPQGRFVFFLLLSLLLHLAAMIGGGLIRDRAFWEPTSGTEAPEGIEIEVTVISGGEEGIHARLPPEAKKGKRGRPETHGMNSGESEAGRRGEGTSPNPTAEVSVLSEIRGRIERAKRYPEAARQAGLEGRVVVRFTIDPEGGVGDASVVESSDSPLLDQAALETIRKAVPYPLYGGPLHVALRFEL